MARTFRRRRESHPISELNVINLIDLGFCLLIIFMIATPLINQEQTIPVNLPVESRSATLKPNPKARYVTITIRAQGDYFFDQMQVSFADLKTRIRALGANPANVVIHIRADSSVPFQKVISVMDELKQNNLHQVMFGTQAGS